MTPPQNPHPHPHPLETAGPVVTVTRGASPLVVSIPHTGTALPEWLRARLVPRAHAVEDTDWQLDRLYAFAEALDATVLVPAHSRYVVDLNRPSDNKPMYAGANNTELAPTRFFTGDALYRAGEAPGDVEVQQRVATFWQPYHDALAAELARVKAAHGHAVLFDAHSIKSELPWLFEGTLPHLNLGTANGASADARLADAVMAVAASQSEFEHVLNGRFKGGHITRHYGRPHAGVHAVQLEMCWRCYIDEAAPDRWDEARAARVQPLLERMLRTMRDWRPAA